MSLKQSDSEGIKIGEVIKATGVTRATIHHYVKEGLLPQPVKTSRNMALYSRDCVERILLIKGLQHHSRRSLADVKTLLADASDDEGLRRLQQLLDVEATRAHVSPLNPDRPREALSITQLAERTGFSLDELRKIEKLGLITGKNDVDVVESLASLAEAGFTSDAGFVPEDAVIYLDALRDLLHKEVGIFLQRTGDGGDPQEVLRLARNGVERVTPLILALRRKVIGEFIDATPLPESFED